MQPAFPTAVGNKVIKTVSREPAVEHKCSKRLSKSLHYNPAPPCSHSSTSCLLSSTSLFTTHLNLPIHNIAPPPCSHSSHITSHNTAPPLFTQLNAPPCSHSSTSLFTHHHLTVNTAPLHCSHSSNSLCTQHLLPVHTAPPLCSHITPSLFIT